MEFIIKIATSIISLALLVGFVGVLSSCIKLWALPRSIPVPGAKSNTFLSRTIAHLTSWSSYHESRGIAYAEFSAHGRAFISPSPSLSPDIVIPPEHVRWLLNQPCSVLAQRPALWEGMAIRYMFPSADPGAEFIPALVKRHMSLSRIDAMQGTMARAIQRWTDAALGGPLLNEKEWNEVALLDAVGSIMSKVGYIIYFGPELAEDEELAGILRAMGNWAAIGGLVIGQFSPAVFRTPLGWLFRVPLGYYARRYKRKWEPVIREKLRRVQREGVDTAAGSLDATTGAAEALSRSKTMTVESISTNFMIMYGIASNVKLPGCLALLLNLICPPNNEIAQNYLPLLQREIETVLGAGSDHEPTAAAAWADPDSFTPHKMPLTTAFTRESMRYSPLVANIPVRTVVAKDGVVLPDGTHVPQGAWLTCPAEAMTRDARFFPEPDVFDPFRWLEVCGDEKGGELRYKLRADGELTASSESFLFFGYGRHFCPGRFFMVRLLMILLAYIVKNYDFKPTCREKPVPIRAGFVNLPPLGMRARFRRRREGPLA